MSDATARLPWHRGGRQTSYIYDADGKVVAESAGLEFVALIVHRVNAHAALVEALEKARRDLRDYGAAPIQQVCEEMKRALDEAKT